MGEELSEEERERYGSALHWALGIGAGALYGALWGRGLAFGTAFFLVMDEGASAVLGLAPGPLHFPWRTHARGLAGHLAFGLAADTALRVLDLVV